MMKNVAFLIFILSISMNTGAQDQLATDVEQALLFTEKASSFSDQANDHLGFYTGSADFQEMRHHFFDARVAIDSMYFNIRRAGYKTADAAYEAGKSQNKNIRAQAMQIQGRLKTASLTLEVVMKKIDFLFGTPDASGPYNLDSYVNQIFEDFGKTQKQLQQTNKEFKMILKTLEEKGE
jgi:hypothetical protein